MLLQSGVACMRCSLLSDNRPAAPSLLPVAGAQAGYEVPAELIKNTPARTLHCNGREFRRLRSLARTGRPLSLCCLPVLNPLSRLYRFW